MVDGLQNELDVRVHDVGRAGGNQVESIAVLLPDLDLARGVFSTQPVGFEDETAAMNAGISGEADLLGSPAPHEHLVTFVGVGCPRAGEFDRAGVMRPRRRQHKGGDNDLSELHCVSLIAPRPSMFRPSRASCCCFVGIAVSPGDRANATRSDHSGASNPPPFSRTMPWASARRNARSRGWTCFFR